MKLIHVIHFAVLYLWEVIRSTGNLAWLVLRPKIDLHPRFVDVPLALEGEFPRFFFACLVSMTPGSLSVSLDAEKGILCVHLLDVSDPDVSIAELKSRIEEPLLRIFANPTRKP
jgi:multisubunit Na+/H+ antiporter MnhE subunit